MTSSFLRTVLLPTGIVASLLLVSCGGRQETACTQQYWDGTVGVCLPEGWTVVERERLDQMGVPEEVVAAFQTAQPVSGQFPNVTVTREALAQPVTGADYSKSAIRSVGTLPGYELIDSRPATVDGQEVTFHIYSAQPVTDQPRSRFYQVSAVSGSGAGFTATAFTPLTVTPALEQQVTAIVTSLTFTEPEAAKE
ncbi:MAG: hypothetical protein PHW10_03980 [Candidatus Peribacteraceae bacterium]|nr:hypothetical protein [Candidatus Peribacteraceae bacterium]